MVTVITRNGCPQCAATKRYLKEHHIAFVEHNINIEPEYIDKMHALGISSAPVVIKDAIMFTGFRPHQLSQLH